MYTCATLCTAHVSVRHLFWVLILESESVMRVRQYAVSLRYLSAHIYAAYLFICYVCAYEQLISMRQRAETLMGTCYLYPADLETPFMKEKLQEAYK